MSTDGAIVTKMSRWSSLAMLRRKVTRRALRLALGWRTRQPSYRRVWIDVGAHEGETTLPFAAADPTLLVYAFEPDLRVAARVMARLRNFVMLPFAVSEVDGLATLNLASYEQSSSLLPFSQAASERWVSATHVEHVGSMQVPTIRLDTFMERAQIEHLHYLKVDAQGADLAVLKSAGERLRDIDRILVEVTTADYSQYEGTPSRDEVVQFLVGAGFELVGSEAQSFGQEANLLFVRKR